MKKIAPRNFVPSALVGQYVLGHSFKTQDSEFHLLCSDGSQSTRIAITHSRIPARSADSQQRPKSADADVPELEFSENLEAGAWRYHYNNADPFLTRQKRDRCQACDHEGRHSGGQLVRHASLGLRLEGMSEMGWIWCQRDREDTDRYGHAMMSRIFFDIVIETRSDTGR